MSRAMTLTPTPTVPNPVTPEAFLADRQGFWTSFCSFTTVSAAVVVVLLLLMLIFLV